VDKPSIVISLAAVMVAALALIVAGMAIGLVLAR